MEKTIEVENEGSKVKVTMRKIKGHKMFEILEKTLVDGQPSNTIGNKLIYNESVVDCPIKYEDWDYPALMKVLREIGEFTNYTEKKNENSKQPSETNSEEKTKKSKSG